MFCSLFLDSPILTSLYIWDLAFVFSLRLFMTIHWCEFASPLQRKSTSTRPHLGNNIHCFMTVGQQWIDWCCICNSQGIRRYRSNFTMAGHSTIMWLLYFAFALMVLFQLLSSMFQVLSTTARLQSWGRFIANWSVCTRQRGGVLHWLGIWQYWEGFPPEIGPGPFRFFSTNTSQAKFRASIKATNHYIGMADGRVGNVINTDVFSKD